MDSRIPVNSNPPQLPIVIKRSDLQKALNLYVKTRKDKASVWLGKYSYWIDRFIGQQDEIFGEPDAIKKIRNAVNHFSLEEKDLYLNAQQLFELASILLLAKKANNPQVILPLQELYDQFDAARIKAFIYLSNDVSYNNQSQFTFKNFKSICDYTLPCPSNSERFEAEENLKALTMLLSTWGGCLGDKARRAICLYPKTAEAITISVSNNNFMALCYKESDCLSRMFIDEIKKQVLNVNLIFQHVQNINEAHAISAGIKILEKK